MLVAGSCYNIIYRTVLHQNKATTGFKAVAFVLVFPPVLHPAPLLLSHTLVTVGNGRGPATDILWPSVQYSVA